MENHAENCREQYHTLRDKDAGKSRREQHEAEERSRQGHHKLKRMCNYVLCFSVTKSNLVSFVRGSTISNEFSVACSKPCMVKWSFFL